MKKRFLSIMLVLIMVLSLVACGSKDNAGKKGGNDSTKKNENKAATLTEVVDAMSKVEAKGVTIEGSMDEMNGKLVVKSDGEKASVEVVFDGNSVTDVIYADEVLYVNLQAFAKFYDDYMGEAMFVPAFEQLGVTQKYMSLTMTEIEGLLQNEGMTVADIFSGVEGGDPEELQKIAAAIVKFFGDYLESVKGEIPSGSILSIDGTYAEITINAGNIEKVLNAMKNGDVKPYIEQLAKDLKATKTFAEEDLDVDEGVEGFKEQIDEALDSLDEIKDAKLDAKIGFGVKNGNLSVKGDMSMEEDGNEHKISFSISSDNDDVKISAPSSVITYSEFSKKLSNVNGI